MTVTETMSIRLDVKDKAALAQLASETRRSKSFLAAEAIRAYVAREADIVMHIQEGLEDMKAGRLVSNEVVYKNLIKTINKAAGKKT